MSFATDLRPHVERLGTAEAARLCGVTSRSLQLWMRGIILKIAADGTITNWPKKPDVSAFFGGGDDD